jgi:hypothetical protein
LLDEKVSAPPEKSELTKSHKIENGGHAPKSNIVADDY